MEGQEAVLENVCNKRFSGDKRTSRENPYSPRSKSCTNEKASGHGGRRGSGGRGQWWEEGERWEEEGQQREEGQQWEEGERREGDRPQFPIGHLCFAHSAQGPQDGNTQVTGSEGITLPP